MTTRETLHRLVDELPGERAELARVWLEDLRDATDDDGRSSRRRRLRLLIADWRMLRQAASSLSKNTSANPVGELPRQYRPRG